MPNGELCLALWASVALPVFQHLVTKRWTVLPSGTLFLPKSFLHSCCVRRTDFYPLLRSVASSWIHIGVKRISQACCLHHLKNVEKKFVKHDFGMKNKKGRFFLVHLFDSTNNHKYCFSVLLQLLRYLHNTCYTPFSEFCLFVLKIFLYSCIILVFLYYHHMASIISGWYYLPFLCKCYVTQYTLKRLLWVNVDSLHST